MVRRGSTVRVRQRALQKPCKPVLFTFSVRLNLQAVQYEPGMEPFMEPFRSETRRSAHSHPRSPPPPATIPNSQALDRHAPTIRTDRSNLQEPDARP